MIEIDLDADLLEAQFDFAKWIVRPDGSVRHGRCVATSANGGGMVQGCVGIGIDVAEREVLTKALRKSEEEVRQILDLAPQLVATLGLKRERHYANREALLYYGVSLDEWRQRGSELEVHPDDYDRSRPLSTAHCRTPIRSNWTCASVKGTERIAGFLFGTTHFETTRDS